MVSILVPVYNASQYLRECVASLTGQTYTDLQIVLINDGSTDDSWDILKDLAQQDKRLEVYSQPNSGVAATRNRLLEKANGDFVLFVDSDDWIELDTIETLVEEQLPDANLQVIGEIGVGVMELQAGNIEALAVAMGNGKQIIANNPDLVICDWQFDVKAEYEANVVMMHKGETELLAAVNAALAKAYAAGYYGQWYQEALDLAAAEGAIEQSYDDAGQVIAG